MSNINVLAIGGTGLVGKAFLEQAGTSFASVTSLSRRNSPVAFQGVTEVIEKDSAKWADSIANLNTNPDVFFTSLGTTRAQAGGLEQQRAIDHGINLAAAKAAKEKGADTIVLVSSAGSDPKSLLPYTKLKGEIERDIIALKFSRTIILRPGVLLGERESSHGVFAVALGKACSALYKTPLNSTWFLQSSTGPDVASAAIRLITGFKPNDKGTPQVKFVNNNEILALSRAS